MSVKEIKKSANQVSKSLKKISRYVPCVLCGRYVRRYPSQFNQAKLIFCSQLHMHKYYQGLHKGYNQQAFGVSLLIAKSLKLEIDPWTLLENNQFEA